MTNTRDAGSDPSLQSSGLALRDLTVRYGGNVAVSNLTLDAPVGRLTGLIGPNGAGKTTTFNACSGLVRPSSGSVWLFDMDVTGASPAARARRGLGRTFQRLELCPSMTVLENVTLGCQARFCGNSPWRQLFFRGAVSLRARAESKAALALCGISDLADEAVATLSTGRRRLVELARVVAGGYQMLLLDEPSSGLDARETEQFGRIIRDLVDASDIGILLVEHDISLVMNVCEYLYVLDFGTLIFEGTPAETEQSQVVRAAYLGGTADESSGLGALDAEIC